MKRAISKKVILYLEDNVSMSLKAVGCLLTSLNMCNYVLLEHKMLPLKSIRTGNEQKTAKMVKKLNCSRLEILLTIDRKSGQTQYSHFTLESTLKIVKPFGYSLFAPLVTLA